MNVTSKAALAAALIGLSAQPAAAFFLDGSGYYGLLGETRIGADFQKDNGTYQATRVSFDLNGEVRANDRASFVLRLGLSKSPSSFFLGDSARPKVCEARRSPTQTTTTTDSTGKTTTTTTTPAGQPDSTCDSGRSQSALEPGYKDLIPVIREAYGKYAFNYCILSAGRRSRELGLGAYLSSGKNAFDTDANIFDGITCDVNVQKHQDLGFSFGFDKLQETGTWIDNPYDNPTPSDGDQRAFNGRPTGQFGSNSAADDMDQYFLGINFDDLKSKGQGGFAKKVSLYFANVLSSYVQTDVKFFDLYTAFYAGNLAIKNELIFRLGKTADPAAVAMGGLRTASDASGPAVNNVNTAALAGNIEYTLSKSGALLGPEEFNEGNVRRHVIFTDYAYAPGDSNGYYINRPATDNSDPTKNPVAEAQRSNRTRALALNANYHPAMIFFNGHDTSKKYALGGIFDPQRVMNTAIYTLGYRYENMESGNFEIKAITGRLLETTPPDVKTYLQALSIANTSYTDRPVGYFGADLGYELDLNYTYRYQREVELGIGLAAALPGKAWIVSTVNSTQAEFGIVSSLAIKF